MSDCEWFSTFIADRISAGCEQVSIPLRLLSLTDSLFNMSDHAGNDLAKSAGVYFAGCSNGMLHFTRKPEPEAQP